MFDQPQQAIHQRSHGRAKVSFALRNGQTVLQDLAQQGSAKAMLPKVFSPVPEVVFLNTSGGLTGGDVLQYALELDQGTRVTATTQTAERAYASISSTAAVTVAAKLGAGAHLDWLPQETILFNHAQVNRNTQIDLGEGASVLLVESLILGRKAMGEAVCNAALTDRRMIRQQGRPFWCETLRLDRSALADAALPALLGGAQALAVIAFVAQNAQDSANALRDLPCHMGAQMAVSGWNGRCVIRILATDGWPLRQQIIKVISTLRVAPMPRVWQC